MQSRLFVAGVLAGALALSAQCLLGQDAEPAPAGQAAGQNPGQPGARPRRPLPKPTNLQVLPKDIAPEELVHIMRGYAGALGVECKFCHAAVPGQRRLDFAADTKEDKGIARIMIRMTQTINDQYMAQVKDPDAKPDDLHVTCGTCHRGHQMPEHFVPAPEAHHEHGAGAGPGAPQ
ncbi:MAG: c-type cytochrome [Acidobacteriaceae bacterium]